MRLEVFETKEPRAHFLKCYSSLMGAFDPEEVIFLLYMGHITKLGQLGFRTTQSQQYHMMRMGIGRRVFKKCEERFLKIGLIDKDVMPKSIVQYWLCIRSYYKLINILAFFKCTETSRRFCEEVLNGPNAMQVRDLDKECVGLWFERDRDRNGTLAIDDLCDESFFRNYRVGYIQVLLEG
ncbi:MAG: hypothetical protein IKY25_03515 [Alistipes sp.]|nr:hypothetical protein [Alistipes sp.]